MIGSGCFAQFLTCFHGLCMGRVSEPTMMLRVGAVAFKMHVFFQNFWVKLFISLNK